MIKIFLTVRNRLSITTKCVTAIKKHSTIPYQLYVYDNLTHYKVQEHFLYWSILYEKGLVTQVTFNTKESTFNAFSKAVACNQFGFLHEQDPQKDSFDFLLFLDNDIILSPGYDTVLKNAWEDVKKYNMKDIKIITQLPGGITSASICNLQIANGNCKVGYYGGSGLWSVRPNFFREIGFLDLKRLVGHNKKHDQEYWKLLASKTGNKPYILGLSTKLGLHTGSMVGSVCNVLTKHPAKQGALEKIKFPHVDEEIDKLTFDEFYEKICSNEVMRKW